MNNFSRATSAFVLTASLLVSSVAAVASKRRLRNQPKILKRPTKPSRSRRRRLRRRTTAKSNKPLSTNEDPNMIGKRNINTGIIAKMSGSTEKEVRLGRELAAEVDRQAKFVDDPLITEYVNRVGQNIVLHSDAKGAIHHQGHRF